MRYIDRYELAGEPVAVAQFGGDPFAVEGEAIAQVDEEIENACDIVEILPEDEEFRIEAEKLGFRGACPQRLFIAYPDYNEPYFSFVLEFDCY